MLHRQAVDYQDAILVYTQHHLIMEHLELGLMEYSIQTLTPLVEAVEEADMAVELVSMVTHKVQVPVVVEVAILIQLNLRLIIQIAY